MDSKPAPPKRSSTSGSTKNASSSRPSSSRRESKKPGHENCDCVDCRDLSYRDKQGASRRDQNGDEVKEWNEDEAPRVHCHVQPGLFEDEEQLQRPSGPRRSETQGSSRSERRRSSEKAAKPNTSHTIDSKGDHVQEWDGAEAPAVRTHYDWDAEENKPRR